MPKRILFCWLGYRDLWEIFASLDAATKAMVRRELPAETSHDTQSPIRILTHQEQFDEIHILHTFDSAIAKAFVNHLNRPAILHHHPMQDPTDFAAVYQAAIKDIKDAASASAPRQLCYHLSPGTATMTAIWLLLGKSLFPGEFWKTYKGKALPVTVPFDLTVDFVPHLDAQRQAALEAAADKLAAPTEFSSLIGKSGAIVAAKVRAGRVANLPTAVLLTGEIGTGKELFARAIHAASGRKDKQFSAINCAALPTELLESQLFGHKKGAFTGAAADYSGAFEQAQGGTLFLDEISECSPAMQSKLLRVLQPPDGKPVTHRVFRPLGATKDCTADVRLICATNRDLQQEIKAGTFRDDLYYRIAAFTIHLPPLRDRSHDRLLLAQHALDKINTNFAPGTIGQKSRTLSASAKAFIESCPWPGNFRELYNVLNQAAIMSDSPSLHATDLKACMSSAPPSLPSEGDPLPDHFDLDQELKDCQRRFIVKAMRQARGNKTRAAALLGYSNGPTLAAQIKRHKLQNSDWQ